MKKSKIMHSIKSFLVYLCVQQIPAQRSLFCTSYYDIQITTTITKIFKAKQRVPEFEFREHHEDVMM